MKYCTYCRATRWCAARTTSLPKTVYRKSSTRTRLQSCATPTMPISRGNIGSPCTWTASGTAITLTRTDCSRNTSSSRTLWTNIALSGRPTIARCRAHCLPFAVNIVSLSCCFAAVMSQCMYPDSTTTAAHQRPIVTLSSGPLMATAVGP